MIRRRTTLDEALQEIESATLRGVTAIVVSDEWWRQLPQAAQTAFRRRCQKLGVVLRADEAISRHYVELASDPGEPPLSTERLV
ncbi:MAG TPA: hypothetical protein VFZ73_05780 [Gemmatimonadaceae bacterium]